MHNSRDISNFKNMIRAKTVTALLIITTFALTACSTQSSTEVGGLSFEGYTFGRSTADQQIEATETTAFAPGDQIHLILKNVGPFQAGEDGKHRLDMDLEIKNADREIIFEQSDILGEAGVTELEQGIADTPYGTFHSGADLPTGKYTIKLTIHDKVGGGYVSQKASFTLE